MASETRERHRIVLSIDDGCAYAQLVCPPSGCETAHGCSECGRDLSDETAERCYDCPPDTDECWLKTWADNEDLTAYMRDQALGAFEIEETFKNGELVVAVVPPPASKTREEFGVFGIDEDDPRENDELGSFASLEEARSFAASFNDADPPFDRLAAMRRTVTTTDWEEVPDAGE